MSQETPFSSLPTHMHACQLASKSGILANTIFPSQTPVYAWPVCVLLQLLHILFRFHAGFSCGEELKVKQSRRKDILRMATSTHAPPTDTPTQFLCQFRIAELRNNLLINHNDITILHGNRIELWSNEYFVSSKHI